MPLPCAGINSSLPGLEDRQNEEMISSALESGDGHNPMVQPSLQQSVTSMVTEQHPSSVDPDNIVELLLDAPDEDCSNLTSNRIDIDEVSCSSIYLAENSVLFFCFVSLNLHVSGVD